MDMFARKKPALTPPSKLLSDPKATAFATTRRESVPAPTAEIALGEEDPTYASFGDNGGHHAITHIMSIVRFSAYDTSTVRQAKALQAAEERIAAYMHRAHGTEGRTCTPRTSIRLINGLSSNTDISQAEHKTIIDIQNLLQSTTGRVAFSSFCRWLYNEP